MIKKTISFALIITSLFLITACNKEQNVEGTLEEIMKKVYQELPQDETPMMLQNVEINEENIEYYLGTSNIEYEEALASESATGSIAHSVVLLRTKHNADIEKIKTEIKENVDPRKWICVGVEKEDIIVKSKGDLVILIMTNSGKEKLEMGFDNL